MAFEIYPATLMELAAAGSLLCNRGGHKKYMHPESNGMLTFAFKLFRENLLASDGLELNSMMTGLQANHLYVCPPRIKPIWIAAKHKRYIILLQKEEYNFEQKKERSKERNQYYLWFHPGGQGMFLLCSLAKMRNVGR